MKKKYSPNRPTLSIIAAMLALVVLAACVPAATPQPEVPPTATPLPEPTAVVEAGATLMTASEQWRGIGRITISSTCTAVLIDTGAGAEAPAFILTNGHCVEWMANGAITNQMQEGEVIFNYFVDTQDAQVAVPLAEVVYSTMQGVDIAIIRLDATYADLAAQNIMPYNISDTPLDLPSQVRVIGAPTSGVNPDEAYLREELCQTSTQTDLLEFNWHFYDPYVTTCQDIFGGSSGSPMFSADNTLLYGLINTTVEGISACYLGVPCEVGADGVTINADASYATPIHGLTACFTDEGAFSLSENCPLPPTQQLSFSEQPNIASQPPLAWDTTLTGDLAYYRYKTGAAGVVNCRVDEGYSSPIALATQPTIPDAIPDAEGFYLLCVLAGNSATVDDSWQSPAYPTVAIAQIDTTPPLLDPQLGIREMGSDYYDVALIFSPPELSNYLYKFGPKDEVDCADEADYVTYRRIPLSIERKDGVAMRLCVIGFDNADNPTPTLDKVLGE